MDKKASNLQLKFILVIGGFGIICSVALCLLVYIRYHEGVISSLRNTLESAGRLVEAQMPVLGDVDYIRKEGIAESEAYVGILRDLKKYSDVFGFTYVYLFENGADGFVFLLDTDKLGKDTDSTFLKPAEAPVMEYLPYAVKTGRTILSDMYTDKYGTFISAFVPVIRQNKVVSVIGLDYDISVIRSTERKVLSNVILSLAMTTVFVIVMSVLISKAFVKMVHETDKLNKQLISMNEVLATLSTTDELTKLNNRRSFLEYLDIIWKQNHRLRLPITVLMIDIDYFKRYNDSLGHLEGDKALAAVARCIKGHAKRDTDFTARYGGEEFVCVLPFIDKTEAVAFAKTLVEKVEAMKIPHPSSEHSEYLTISVGLAAAVPDDNNSYIKLLNEADKALYLAKESGRNRAVIE